MLFASASAGKANEGRNRSLEIELILLHFDVWIILSLFRKGGK